MARNWTSAQLDAMNTRGKTLLVSAAAGSGKTATLTERIIRQITDKEAPADISQMLIVTFTRAAAAELRSRIFSALGDALAEDPTNKHLSSQLMKIGSAKICTIDAFYLDVLRSNFSSLDICAGFRLADDSEYQVLAQRAMEDSIDEMYENDETFPVFTECFSTVRASSKIGDIFLELYDDLTSLPEGIEFVKICAERTEKEAELDFFASSYGGTVRQNTIDVCMHYSSIFASALEYMQTDVPMENAYERSFTYDAGYCARLYNALCDQNNGYAQTKELLEAYAPISLGSLSAKYKSESSEKYKQFRTNFSAKIKNLRDKTFSKSPEMIQMAMRDTAKHLYTLYRLLECFEKRISEEKTRRSLMTFSDVRRYTLKLLVAPDGTPTDIARKYAEQYSDIYIDEYQDVDRVQDSIFCSIARADNRFMVGDIKQSIYGFRGAEPMLFSSYRKSFPPLDSDLGTDSDSATIFMSNNFRCDENVIDFTNKVCSTIFSACAESIGYTSADDLKFSKALPHSEYVSNKVKVALITPPEDFEGYEGYGDDNLDTDSEARKQWEAKYIAREISRLIREERKANGEPILPGDIAVLFRAKSMSSFLADALRSEGILYVESDGEHYFEDPDVLMMLCILNAIDNPERDVYLAGALRSPLFNFEMDELIKVRNTAPKNLSLYRALIEYANNSQDTLSSKCSDFIKELEKWQSEATSLSVDRFLRMLFDSERFVSSGLISQTNSSGEGGNLLMLYEYARKFENGTFKGLYQFVEYINSVISNGGKLSSDNKGSSEDRVSLMTIHKSKGLEFPVCFICNTGASARSRDSKNSMVYESSSGIALKIADGSGFARINTPMRDAILTKISDKQMEEEMRVLYVALTRARERLYITASTSSAPEKLLSKARTNAQFLDRYTIMNKCSSYLDWVLLAMQGNEDSTFELDTISANMLETEPQSNVVVAQEEDEIDCELVKRLCSEFSFSYQYQDLSKVPSKLSVSRLYPDILDEADNSFDPFTDVSRKTPVPDFFLNKKSSASGADRGTATHLFLQFCDFERLAKIGVEEELSRLEEKRFLPPHARELIYIEELEAFRCSDLLQKILSSAKIIREQRFNVELSAEGFSSNADLLEKMRGESLAVQGVIDLVLIDNNGNISLYDYKTDRLSRDELGDESLAKKRLKDAHSSQLSYYEKAIELLFGQKCSRVAIYSTHAARLFDIETAPVLDTNVSVLD